MEESEENEGPSLQNENIISQQVSLSVLNKTLLLHPFSETSTKIYLNNFSQSSDNK